MIQTTFNSLLLTSILLPLVFAIPLVRRSLPHDRFLNPISLSFVPGLLLLIYPRTAELELDWLFFGSGFELDNGNRWLLATTMITWIFLSSKSASLQLDKNSPETIHNNSYALLCITGMTGTILSTDILGFFIFSSFMGYAFYGVIFIQQDRHLRNAGTLYISFLFIADIALFDALLIAVHTIENLQFDVIQIYMSDISTNQLYVIMTLTGFILRGAIWPAHLWLSRTSASVNKLQAGLLSTLPVAMALLGLIHWLPTDQGMDENISSVLQIISAGAVIYALLRILTGSTGKQLTTWLTLIYSGIFLYILSIFFNSETAWQTYEFAVIPYIAIGSLVLSIFCWRQPDSMISHTDKFSTLIHKLEHRLLDDSRSIILSLKQVVEPLNKTWRLLRKNSVHNLQKIFYAGAGKNAMEWSAGIILLIFLGILIAGLG